MKDKGQSDRQKAFNEEVMNSLTTRAGQEGAKDMTREMEMILEGPSRKERPRE